MTRGASLSLHGGHSSESCAHARGTLDEVVEAAVRAGLSVFGVSEHAPRDRPEDLYPDEVEAGLGPGDLEARFAAYADRRFAEVEARFVDRIALLKGMETEVVPATDWASRMRELRARHRIEYLVGSVHHVHGLPIDLDRASWVRAAEISGGPEALALDYYRLQAEVLARRRPAGGGHFDYVKRRAPACSPPSPGVRRAIDENLELAREVGALLEVNGKAFRKGLGEPYPSLAILERARAIGVRATLGDDSHGPDEVGRDLDRCREALLAAGYDQVHFLARTPGGLEVRAGGILGSP